MRIGCLDGPELLFQDVVKGDLFTQVDFTMDLLYTKYSRGLISYIYRVETFPVPYRAMREAVVNAVVHRDYTSREPTRIRVRDDRISIRNAARLAPGWSAGGPAGDQASRLRNPRIAYAFFQAGMIEAWGRGIRGMMDECHEVGNPTPEWRVEGDDGLSVTFPFSEAYMEADAAARGTDVPRTTPKTTPKTTQIPETARKQPETEDINRSLADRIVAFLRENPSASRRRIAEALAGTTEGSVRYQLDKLKRVNRLRRVGPDRGGRWRVLDGDDDGQPPENRQKPAVTTRKPPETEDSGQQLADRILAALRQDPSAGRHELAAILGTTESTVRYRLGKLRAEGKIERVGPDKGGRWRVLHNRHA